MEKEKENFFRFICLMTEIVVEVLRCRLKQSYRNSKLPTLPSFLQEINVLHTIFHLFFPTYLCCWRGCRSELAKGFSKEQWAILYDADSSRCCKQNRKDMDKLCICCVTPKQVDESKLDLSLLSLILINCCNLMPHEKEAVRKIREMKNLYISHSSKFSLSNSDFKSLWHEAEYLIKQLNSTHVYLNKQLNLLHRPMDEALMQKYFVHCLESSKIEHLESEMKVVHASIIEGNENVMEAIQELKSSFEHHQRESMHTLEVTTTKRKRPESTKCFDLSNEQDTADDCMPRNRKLQKLMAGLNLNQGNVDHWTYKIPDTKPLDQFREYISSNHLGSNVSTSASLQMDFTIFTMKDLSKQKDFKDTDKFICGKCNWLFVSLDEFLKHKEECKIIQKKNEVIKAEYKKYVVARLTVSTTDPDLSSKVVKDWQQGNLNPKHKSLEVNYITTGSVLIWVKVDVLLFFYIKHFYSALDYLVNDIFQKYTARVPLYRVDVYDMATGYVDHLEDDFFCGDCKLNCTTLDDFITHKNTKCFQPLITETKRLSVDTNVNETESGVVKTNGKPHISVTLESGNLYSKGAVDKHKIRKEHLLNKTKTGYQRFFSKITDKYPDEGTFFCHPKKDSLVKIEPSLCSLFLKSSDCIVNIDMGKTTSKCDYNERFQAFQRRQKNLSVLFNKALNDSDGNDVKAKMDPGATRVTDRHFKEEKSVKRVVTPVIDHVSENELSELFSLVDLVEDGDKAEMDSDSEEEEKYINEASEKEFCKPKEKKILDHQLELAEQSLTEHVNMEVGHNGPCKTSIEREKKKEEIIYQRLMEDSKKVFSQSKEIKLREYQLELAEKALNGKNTVICADTGSGKTWVALHIVQEHLNSKESPKVAFMARTNPLVQQQYTLFKNLLGEKKVYIINKDERSTVPLNKLMEIYDVFFFTPQILINNIEKGDTRLLQFTLLILDECHHTAKGDPYNNLMRKYIKTKHINKEIPLPQIVGLTASIGVGADTAEEGAIQHMIKIFSNLDVHEISTVERNKEEMKKFVAIPTEEHVKMEVSYKDPCKEIIEEEMKKVENIYENLMKRKGNLNSRQNLPGGDYLSKTYLGSIIKLKNQIMCDTTLPEDSGREMICCITHLGILHEALDINYLMNVEHVIQFLNKKYVEENQQPDRLIAIERRLLNVGNDLIKALKKQTNIRSNPNLSLIEEKLQELYSKSGKDSLGMIFVQTRATAKSLAEYLNDKLEGIEIPVKPFIGSKSSETSDGLSETEKKELLEDFRSHKIKLLVATSVGSEGIDVPECNIVMKYNYSGNEINIIQMRGRMRKAGGQAIYISDQSVLRRDLVSMEKAAVMHRALDELKQKGTEEIRKLIKLEQQNDLKHQEEQERKLRELQNQKKRGFFKLVCATCKETEILGDNIKLYKQNHYVAAEREFLDRVKKEDIKEEKINQMIRKSIIYCKNCPQKLGKIFLIHDLEVPLLKIDAFLCKEGDKLRKYKNWKCVPYIIDEINHKDLEIIFPKLTTPKVS